MRDKNFKQIIVNVGLFALFFSFSLWQGEFLHPFFPSLALLLLAHLLLEWANGLGKVFQIPIYILSLAIYPMAFDFFRFALRPSFLNGLIQFILSLYFLRLFLSFQKSLLAPKSLKYKKNFGKFLSSLSFGIIGSYLQIDSQSLYQWIQKFSTNYLGQLALEFSLEKAIFFFLMHLAFAYLVEWLIGLLWTKK